MKISFGMALACLLVVCAAIKAPAQKAAKKADKTALYYVARPAQISNTKPPLLILMHGYGSNELDLFSLADQLPGQFLIIAARGPYTLGKDSYAWYEMNTTTGQRIGNAEEAEKSRTMILQFIEQLKKTEVFDERKIYLGGFSQGAIMSYSVGLTRPDEIKGIAVMSGRIPDEVKPKVKGTADLKKLQVFISHGTQDPVLDIHYARDAKAYLAKLGITPAYKEYNDVHTINRAMLADLVSWLSTKK